MCKAIEVSMAFFIFINLDYFNMLRFPNCKINIGLHITQKRDDNFHDLETIFYPLNCCDALEIIESDKLHFEIEGQEIPGEMENNLVVKAYNLLKKDFPQIKPLHIFLLKKIPTGAGLGGGSSDAAFMLKMLNDFFNLGIADKSLEKYALDLGSDCPFFISNKVSYAKGRGEKLEEISLDLSSYNFVVVKPNFNISTAWAFSQIIPNDNRKSLLDIIQQPIATWSRNLKNDFEESVFQLYPKILTIKQELQSRGAVYCSMSGSGSAVYGIFNEKQDREFIQSLFPDCFVYVQ